MRKNKLLTFITSIVVLILLNSCNLNTEYESIKDIEEHLWMEDSTMNFDFEIKEEGNYNVFLLVKNKTTYRYYNLYFKANFRSENELISDKLQEVILFHPKTGEPYGKGLSGIMEHQFLAFPNQKLKKGKHSISLKQYMRVAQLKDIMAIGVKVEKSSISE